MEIKIILSLLCVFIFVFLSACGENEESAETTGYQYISSSTQLYPADSSDFNKSFRIDASWQKNFSVDYEYFNVEQDGIQMYIKERKSENAFIVEDADKKTTLYYKPNGADTDYYFIVEGKDEQIHSLLKGKNFSSLSSLFMKLSLVDGELPSQKNVLYMYEETVAGRNCHKYIQRAYSEGKLTQSVYVWVDAQYGFAAKCESYDAKDSLKAKWEIKEFSAGDVEEKDVDIDISKYKFIEQPD